MYLHVVGVRVPILSLLAEVWSYPKGKNKRRIWLIKSKHSVYLIVYYIVRAKEGGRRHTVLPSDCQEEETSHHLPLKSY